MSSQVSLAIFSLSLQTWMKMRKSTVNKEHNKTLQGQTADRQRLAFAELLSELQISTNSKQTLGCHRYYLLQ